MNNLLSASCVFDYLQKEKKVLQPFNKDTHWKNTATTQTSSYACHFFIKKNNLDCLETFQIIIYKGHHCLAFSSIQRLLYGSSSIDSKHILHVLKNCVVD